MSKELEALKKIKEIIREDVEDIDNPRLLVDEIDIIENALKRLEEHDKIFRKYDINDNWLEPTLYVIKNHFPMDTETQLKKLKALEIIKKKKVDTYELRHRRDVESYNEYKWSDCNNLTKKEFDLLKEVLL